MKKLLLLAVIVLIGVAASAQDSAKETPKQEQPKATSSKPLNAYKLQVVLRELLDGKVVNTRDYAAVMQEGFAPIDLKIGSKVPAKNLSGDLAYMDIGTSIRCWDLRAQPPWLGLNCTFEISNFALPEQQLASASSMPPVLNQLRANIATVVEEGKPTVIGSIDDPNSTKRYEIALTAAKVK